MAKQFRFRVKPRQAQHVVPCAPELSALLACFASSGDMRSTEACAQASKSLHHCMANAPKPVKKVKPTINYLLRKVK